MRGIGVGASAADRGLWSFLAPLVVLVSLWCFVTCCQVEQAARVSPAYKVAPFRWGDKVCVKEPGGQRIVLVGSADNTAWVEYCDGTDVVVSWQLPGDARALARWPISAAVLVPPEEW